MSVMLSKKEPIGCFWKIKQNDATVGYLLGSMHRAPTTLLELNGRIHKCFAKSHCLALEIDYYGQDVNKSYDLERKKQWEEKWSTLSPQQTHNITDTLKNLFREKKGSEVLDFGNDKEKSDFIFECISDLKSRVWTKAGLSSGIDDELHNLAKKANKPIENLETIEEQEATQEMILQNDPLQDLFLQVLSKEEWKGIIDVSESMDGIIKNAARNKSEQLEPMFNAWEKGSLEEFDASETDSIDEAAEMEKRNSNMAMRIAKLASSKTRAFCCIGAAHTVGKLSVQNFLKELGFSTERVLIQ